MRTAAAPAVAAVRSIARMVRRVDMVACDIPVASPLRMAREGESRVNRGVARF